MWSVTRIVTWGARVAGALLVLAGALQLYCLYPRAGGPRPRRPAPAPGGPAAPPRVADLYVAGWSAPHAELCPRGARTRLLVLVASAPAHAAPRAALRGTWGAAARRADVALAFVLGAPPPGLRARLAREDALHGDLVQGRYVDSYGNLTLKLLNALEWAARYCRAPRILKVDDDVFVNVPLLLRFIAAAGPARRTIWGNVVRDARPSRNASDKHRASVAEFPGARFPPFASGAAFLLTGDCAGPLAAAARGARFLRLDDVLFTGVLAAALRLRRRHAPAFYRYDHGAALASACSLQRRVLGVHTARARDMFELWRRLHDTRAACAPRAAPARPGDNASELTPGWFWECCEEPPEADDLFTNEFLGFIINDNDENGH